MPFSTLSLVKLVHLMELLLAQLAGILELCAKSSTDNVAAQGSSDDGNLFSCK